MHADELCYDHHDIEMNETISRRIYIRKKAVYDPNFAELLSWTFRVATDKGEVVDLGFVCE